MNKQFFENIPIGTSLFGRFTLLSVISASDSGCVYLCKSTWGELRGKIIALKVTESNPRAMMMQEQLMKEIKILSRIRHPNIIQAYDWFQDESFLAYSMEYVEGGTLDTVLEHSSTHSIAWSLNFLNQLAQGLKAIHQAGIVHRDLKPQNILVTGDHQLKIADFGIAVRVQSGRREKAEQVTGTIDFVSPEFIRDGTYDERSDIYAWGVIAYLMLSGHVPFEDESIVDALTRKATEDPRAANHIRQDIPQGLSDLISKALARRPRDRFQDIDELLVALAPFGVKSRPTQTLRKEAKIILLKDVA